MFETKKPFSFKLFPTNSSDKFKEFQKDLSKHFPHVRPIKTPKDSKAIPSHLIFERILFFSILQRLSQQYFSMGNSQQISKKLNGTLQKYRTSIISSSSLSFQVVQKNEKLIDKYLTNFATASSQPSTQQTNTYIGFLIFAICNKKQEKKLFSKAESIYSKNDLQMLSSEFGFKIFFGNYDKDKNFACFNDVCRNDICILKARQLYYILYSDKKNLNEIKIIETEKKIPNSQIEKLFIKKQQEPSKISKVVQNKQQSVIQKISDKPQDSPNKIQDSIAESQSIISFQKYDDSSILRPTRVQCSVCSKQQQQFDCINWNYQFFCGNCIISPNINTSDIPPSIINKYCRDRNIAYKSYDIICPQCSGISKIRNYQPMNKPKVFNCDVCTKTICLQHNGNIFSCFCICDHCKTQTFYIPKMNINYCQYCKKRYCFKCQKKGKQFCKCICPQCLGEDSATHQCQPNCHRCRNLNSKLRTCLCGLYICYGCYYFEKGKASNNNGKFQCRIEDYC